MNPLPITYFLPLQCIHSLRNIEIDLVSVNYFLKFFFTTNLLNRLDIIDDPLLVNSLTIPKG